MSNAGSIYAQTNTNLDAHICVVDQAASQPLADATVQGRVEGEVWQTGLTGSDGCVTLSIVLPVGIEDENGLLQAFRVDDVYPNPLHGRAVLPVETQSPVSLILDVYDVQGRLVVPGEAFTALPGVTAIPIDLSALPAGLYLYRLSDGSSVHAGKLVNLGPVGGRGNTPVVTGRRGTRLNSLASVQRIEIQVEKTGYETVTMEADVTAGQTIEIPLETAGGSNEAPEIVAQNDVSLVEGDSLQLTLSATDADSDPLLWSVVLTKAAGGEIPSRFFSFTDTGDGTAQFSINSIEGDAGTYTVGMNVTDGNVAVTDSFSVFVSSGSDTTMTPINDLGTGTYLGYEGGLYPNGLNEAPAMHHVAGLGFGNGIEPLNVNGQPDPNGKYILMSIGMSNTTQEFCSQDANFPCDAWTFMGQAAADPAVNTTNLEIVNGSRGSRPADDWIDPQDVNYERVKNDRLDPQGLSEAQVQIVWVKVANPRPQISLPDPASDAFRLEAQLGQIARALKVRYPNIKQIFISSRIYAGYSAGISRLNPEPYAYESGFATKWAVEAQINQMDDGTEDELTGDLNYNTVAPWMAWGPYMWADGANPRSDGLFWVPEDFADDFTHPDPPGEEKVGAALLEFFKTSPYTQCWFVAGGVCE
ncbi:MAG: T9SS type A sorting domain-containing protein [Bacteroidota bacterium]